MVDLYPHEETAACKIIIEIAASQIACIKNTLHFADISLNTKRVANMTCVSGDNV